MGLAIDGDVTTGVVVIDRGFGFTRTFLGTSVVGFGLRTHAIFGNSYSEGTDCGGLSGQKPVRHTAVMMTGVQAGSPGRHRVPDVQPGVPGMHVGGGQGGCPA